MDKLRECPFCGNEGDIAEGQTYGFARQFQPCCRHCGVALDIYDTCEQAITAWNTRADEHNEPLSLEELDALDGEPVYIVDAYHGGMPHWAIWDTAMIDDDEAEDYGKSWLAYRQKPKEDD